MRGPAKAGHYGALVAALSLAVNAHAQSPLADRIQARDRAAALALIAKGADVNQTQPDGTTPLHWAVYTFDRELVQAMLRKGARVDARNRYGSSPLAEAARVGNLEIAEMLLEAGADPNVGNEDGQTPPTSTGVSSSGSSRR